LDGVGASIATPIILPSIGTIELWVHPTSLSVPSSTQTLLGTHGVANGDDRLWLVSSGPVGGPGVAPHTMVVNVGSRFTNDLVVLNPLVAGVWTHLAVTFDYQAEVYELYVNGLLAAAATAPRTSPTQALRLGGGTSDFGQNFFFNGVMDEVAVYNRALSAGEIQGIFEAGSAGKCDPGGSCVGTGSASLGGRIRDSISGLVPNVTLTITGPGCRDSVASPTGRYLLPNLGFGTYTVTPTKTGCTFTPDIWTGTLAKRKSVASFSGVCP
jgi:Concanavalin A-like lectin/glucanases superfamily